MALDLGLSWKVFLLSTWEYSCRFCCLYSSFWSLAWFVNGYLHIQKSSSWKKTTHHYHHPNSLVIVAITIAIFAWNEGKCRLENLNLNTCSSFCTRTVFKNLFCWILRDMIMLQKWCHVPLYLSYYILLLVLHT